MCGIRSLVCTKYSVADFEARVFGGRGSRQYSPGKFDARDPWQRWLVLVFALYLEEIKEICAGRVDFDEILIGRGGRGGEVGDF
jgi:hypothetical protein